MLVVYMVSCMLLCMADSPAYAQAAPLVAPSPQTLPTATRICRVYRMADAQSLNSTHGVSPIHVAQPMNLDSVAVMVHLELHDTCLSDVSLWLSASPGPDSAAAAASHDMAVLLKALGAGGTGSALVNVTFLDAAPSKMGSTGSPGCGQDGQPHASYRPAQSLAAFVFGSRRAAAAAAVLMSQDTHQAATRSACAAQGGTLGSWRLTVNGTQPSSDWSVHLIRWHLTLCGTKLPPNATAACGFDAHMEGGAQPVAANTTGAGADNTTQQQSAAGLRNPLWRSHYEERVLQKVDIIRGWVDGNSSLLDPELRLNLGSRLQDLKEQLGLLPEALSVDVDLNSPADVLKNLTARLGRCYHDLYLCYQDAKGLGFSGFTQFPVVELDADISRRFWERVKAPKSKLLDVELQIKSGLQVLQERFPNLAARVGQLGGLDAEQRSSLLQAALTRSLYIAAFDSAAVAYMQAYVDAVIGFLLFTNRYQLALNPRVVVYRIVAILQGVLSSVLTGVSQVPLFPQLLSPNVSFPILISTARSTAGAVRSAVDMVVEGMGQNAAAAFSRRAFTLDSLATTAATTSASVEANLAQVAPNLAGLFGALSQGVRSVAQAQSKVRDQTQALLSQRQALPSELLNQTRAAMQTLGSIVQQLLHETSTKVQEAQGLLDAVIPGPSPSEIRTQLRDQISVLTQRASEAVQRVVPLSAVGSMVQLYNSTVDGLLGELQQGADALKAELPGPALRTALNTTHERIQAAQQVVNVLFEQVDNGWPGPWLNASLSVLQMRTKAVASDINAVLQEARQTFPALDPQVLFNQLSSLVDGWASNAEAWRSTWGGLLPAGQDQSLVAQLSDPLKTLADSLGATLGQAAQVFTTNVVPAVSQAAAPVQQSVQQLTKLVDGLNARLGLTNTSTAALPQQPLNNPASSSSGPAVGRLFQQVQTALQNAANQEPLSYKLLDSINMSLKEVKSVLNQTRPAQHTLDSIFATLNQSTSAWQQGVESLEEQVQSMRPGVLPHVQVQLQAAADEVMSRLSDITHSVAAFQLAWANATGARLEQGLSIGLSRILASLQQGQRVAVQLVGRLQRVPRTALLQDSAGGGAGALPSDVLTAGLRSAAAQVVGDALDRLASNLDAATQQVTSQLPLREQGPVVRAANATSAVAVQALQALRARLQPLWSQLSNRLQSANEPAAAATSSATSRMAATPLDPATRITRRSVQGTTVIMPLHLLAALNSTAMIALQSAASDWKGLLGPAVEGTGDAWLQLLPNTERDIVAGLNQLGQLVLQSSSNQGPDDASSSAQSSTGGAAGQRALVGLLPALRHAASICATAAAALAQAEQDLQQQSMLTTRAAALRQAVEDASEQLEAASMGGVVAPEQPVWIGLLARLQAVLNKQLA